MMEHIRELSVGFMKHLEEWLLLIVAVVCHIGGIYCFRLAGEWTEYSSYSNKEVVGFVFGTILLSFSIPSIIYVLQAIFWMKYPVFTLIWIYLSFAILSIIGLILSCFTFRGYVYLVWDTTNNLSPVITLTSLISMSLCLLFTVICIIHLYRAYATRSVRVELSKRMSHYDVPEGGLSLTETTALLAQTQSDEDDEDDELKQDPIKDTVNQPRPWSDTTAPETDTEEDLIDYIPTSYKSDMHCYRGDSAFCLFVWIAIPVLFFMCALLPFDFSLFLPANIASLEESGVSSYDLRIYLNRKGGYGFNIYPDLLMYYILFMFICNISYLSRKSLWFRIEMRKIRYFIPTSSGAILMKQGEWLLWVQFVIFFAVWAIYWIFVYDGYDNTLETYKWLQRVAMGIGKCAMLCLSISLFAITRNSNIWNTVFHTSYEHMIRFHKAFSYAFLFFALVHLLLWIIYFGISGQLSSNIMFASLPYTYNRRNFTIPAMYYVFILLIIPIFVVLALSRIRRVKYELFYYSHMIGSFIVITLVVWHAKSAWYYVIPPTILYVVDKSLLMLKSTRIAHITGVASLPDTRYVAVKVSIDEIFKSEVYEAAMDVYNKVLPRKQRKLFGFGQYFWINIPSISKYEWHPICCYDSNFSSQEAQFIVQQKNAVDKNEHKEWSEKVCDLADDDEKVLDRMMEIKLDGPYGESIIIDAYRKILIVVGGVGFVSYISFFEYMLKRAVMEETQISVDLVWLCKSPHILLAFKSILRQYADRFDNDPERLFDVRLFYTQRVQSSVCSEIESQLKLSLEFGRPNLCKELSYIEGLGTFTLVMASGPPDLLKATQRVAVRYGAHYRQEQFVL
eukprot:195589_1